MPKQPVDYSKCIIYKIVCRDESVTECYVGHTTNFKSRKNQHKCRSKTINFKVYEMIRSHGNWDNWNMIPICEYPCENHIQACIKEEECRIELQASLNSMKAHQTEEERKVQNKIYQTKEKMQEYRDANKEKISEYQKEYHQTNKEKLAEYAKEYCKTNKEKIVKQQKENYKLNKETIIKKVQKYAKEHVEKIAEYQKEYQKEYAIKNENELKEKSRIYREQNRDKINEKIVCDCGAIIHKGGKLRHEKSLKHQNFILNSNSNGEKD